MSDSSEDYVQCGQSLAKLMPTCELRFAMSEAPRWGLVPDPARLQQKWVATAKQQDGAMWEEHRWRDVPYVIVTPAEARAND